jgi:hypothetical protein
MSFTSLLENEKGLNSVSQLPGGIVSSSSSSGQAPDILSPKGVPTKDPSWPG